MNRPNVVTPEEWLSARRALLEKEKELTRQRDALAAARRELPWVKLNQNYVFEGPSGSVTLADLFGTRSQLIVYHFMYGPGWKEGCPSCSFLADYFDASIPHLAARDVSFAAVSHARYAEIAPFKTRMGWKFPWVSSFNTSFNTDYHVSFSAEEVEGNRMFYNYEKTGKPAPEVPTALFQETPGASVFYKDANGEIFHTYSVYARGLEPGLVAYFFLDLVPKGRDEAGLPWPMAWVRHHDKYVQSVA
ncbi:MAG TPA: DUF899 domain-containing protein [Steroidobacteraceae bacterium]|nr:DUF899 domain-containing protein [Steroidobacteraceae bacterium]